MDAKKLGKRLKLARVEADMNQVQLAKAVGTQQKTISIYENGGSLPSLETLEKLGEALGKPFSYFLEIETL